ncbi:uncharacterized protein [Parasteatoda tepidariorum]|uniref:uncharacterized protein n=1 Tax=Parasteatoda tepidariorum TaxID=114398 RepID=UPI00077FD3DE|nr:uncharacterized protein LOC107457107 [Parasteatoda tepidariorum]
MERRSVTMEDVVKQHTKRCCETLEPLNLKNFNLYCEDRASQSNISHKIVELNKLGNTRFAFINGYKDYKRNFQALHGLKSSDKSDLHHMFKEELEKHMMQSSFLNHQRNVLSFYLTQLKDQCEKSSISDIESLLMKCLTVCNLIPPVSEINSCDEELEQYQNIASILRCCHQKNLNNSHIVTELLKMILNMHLLNSDDAGRIRHESYDNGFLQYVIHHAKNEGINLNDLLSQHSDKLNKVWDFYDQFSILNAMVNEDRERMLFLLRSGVQIFPQHEQMKSGHNFSDISQILTRPQLMILYIMEGILHKNMFDSGAIDTVTKEQRGCFEIICQRVPGTIFPTSHFMRALEDEHEHLLSRGIEIEDCENRRSKTTRLVRMYVNNFYDIPVACYTKIFINSQSVHNMQL